MRQLDEIIDRNDPIVYTIDDIQKILKIGRTNAYQLMSSKDFPSFRLNKKWLVSKEKLDDWINKYSGTVYNY